jgi:hypothetical protein
MPEGLIDGQPDAVLFLRSRDEPLEFLEPVLDEDQFGHRLGLSLFELHHQESLIIHGDIPTALEAHPSEFCAFKLMRHEIGYQEGLERFEAEIQLLTAITADENAFPAWPRRY